MNLVFAGDRCCDHSPSSGYDQICSLFPDAGWLSGRALERGEVVWHREPAASVAEAPDVFHVFYGDCSGKPLPVLLRERFPGAVIVSSAHQPVGRLMSDAPALAALKASDAIVTVSELQRRELIEAGLTVPVHAVPHGVWTSVFRPRPSADGDRRKDVLFVGSFLRDWEEAKQVAAELAREGIRPIALGAGPREHLAGDVPIDVAPRVSEEELARMYDRAAAVFLPFLEATASNALLEAMAAGCPVVCRRLPSLIDEYLGDDSDTYDAGRSDRAAARLLHYVRNPGAREAKSAELIARAEQFDWSRIKDRYAAIFAQAAAASTAPALL